MVNPEDLFEGLESPQIGDNELEVEIINFGDIEGQAKAEATKLVNKIKKIYFTKDELKNDGYAQSVLDKAIDSIALLKKMLMSNQQLHDKLIANICTNSGNGSLYLSLARMQDSIIDIQSQITKELNELHNELRDIKNGDIEDEDDKEVIQESKTAYRGGKDFLKALDNEDDEEY